MALVKMWKQGQLTIPVGLRQELGLEEPQVFQLMKVGGSLLLTPKRLEGDVLAAKAEKSLKKRKLSLEDVLEDLNEERGRYHREVYGR